MTVVPVEYLLVHYSDVTMSIRATQIAGNSSVCLTVFGLTSEKNIKARVTGLLKSDDVGLDTVCRDIKGAVYLEKQCTD